MSDVLDRPLIHPLTESAARYAAAARGAGTCRAYASQWDEFADWCRREGFDPFSGEQTIALHIAGMADAGYSVSTVNVRIAAIRYEYQQADVPLNMDDATLAAIREGVARTLGTAPHRKAAAAVPEALRPMLASRRPHTDARGARDRLLLLLGFGAALRRSELVALRIGDVVLVAGSGLRVTVARSKTDQTGAGETVYVAGNPREPDACPVVAYQAWMKHRAALPDRGAAEGPLLCSVGRTGNLSGEHLSDKSVVLVIKEAATAAGLDAASFSGHSLRRGLLTAAAHNGGDLSGLMRHARHKTPKVTQGYIEDARGFGPDNASRQAWGGAA